MTYHSHATITTLVEDIERTGFGVLPGFVDASELERMRAFAVGAVEAAGGEYAGFIGPDSVAGWGLDELAWSPLFRDMLEKICERGTGCEAPEAGIISGFRCLSGKSVR